MMEQINNFIVVYSGYITIIGLIVGFIGFVSYHFWSGFFNQLGKRLGATVVDKFFAETPVKFESGYPVEQEALLLAMRYPPRKVQVAFDTTKEHQPSTICLVDESGAEHWDYEKYWPHLKALETLLFVVKKERPKLIMHPLTMNTSLHQREFQPTYNQVVKGIDYYLMTESGRLEAERLRNAGIKHDNVTA